MKVSVTREGSVTVVRPIGPLVVGELEDLDQLLLRLFNRWAKRVVVNCSDVVIVDSEGLELLVRHQRQYRSHGLCFKLCHVNETVMKVLDLTRLSGRFEIYPETVHAIRSYL